MYQIGYKIIDKKCQFPILAKAGIEVKAVEQLWESNIFYPYTCTFSYSFQIQRLISSSKSPECLAYFWAGENLLKSLMLYCITLQLIHLQPNQSELWNQVGLVSKVNERKLAASGRFESLLSNNASAKGITSHKRQKKRKVLKGIPTIFICSLSPPTSASLGKAKHFENWRRKVSVGTHLE